MTPHEASPRRNFLRNAIAIVPAGALAATATGCTPSPGLLPISLDGSPADKTQQEPSQYAPRFFQPVEWLFIQAAVARLIPADETGPGAIEAGVPEFIDRQMDAVFGYAAIWFMQGPFIESIAEFGYQSPLAPRDVYRAGIAALNLYCQDMFNGQSFAQLTASQQDTVLGGLEAGKVKFDGVSAKAFFTFLLQNTKEGYLSDPMHGGNKNARAWAMIGFPGARADYADWVGRPGVKYPLPPVSILGPQSVAPKR